MNLREKAAAKRDIIAALGLRAAELRGLHTTAAMTYAPSRGRNAEVRRSDDAMNERKVAEQLGLPVTILTIARARWTLFSTPAALGHMIRALNKLPVRSFACWTLHPDAFIDTGDW